MYNFTYIFCNCYKKKITPEELQDIKKKRNKLLLTFQSNNILRKLNNIF
jgi:hypothetical protein